MILMVLRPSWLTVLSLSPQGLIKMTSLGAAFPPTSEPQIWPARSAVSCRMSLRDELAFTCSNALKTTAQSAATAIPGICLKITT